MAMSFGVFICSECDREAHLRRGDGRLVWYHCADKTALCSNAIAMFAENVSQIKGEYCLADAGAVGIGE